MCLFLVVRMSTEGGFGGTSSSDAQQSLQSFWPRVMEEIRNLTVVRRNEKLLKSVKSFETNNPNLDLKQCNFFILFSFLITW